MSSAARVRRWRERHPERAREQSRLAQHRRLERKRQAGELARRRRLDAARAALDAELGEEP